MEKEAPDSMATVTMKPDYPPSEVYSTSEPPPAYRQRVSSSVQIARIAALTIVASAFILGSFILASSWVSARAGCQQLEQLDAMLDKELALEGRAYGNDGLIADEPLPIGNAHALHAPPPSLQPPAPSAPQPASQTKEEVLKQAPSNVNEDKLQKLDDDSREAKDDNQDNDDDNSDSSDSSAEDDDDLDIGRPAVFKMPIQFDLDELAGAFLANNNKGRMNCVIERRREDPMERRFPFNILGAFAPRSTQGAERIAIICHGGDNDEPRPVPGYGEPAAQVFAFPLSGPARMPLRPPPPQHQHQMPPRPNMMPQPPQRPMPFPMSLPWESSEESMPQPQMRIHVQRVIAIPAHHNQEPMGPFPPPPPPQDNNEQSSVIHQFVPQPAPTQEMEQPEKMQMDGVPMAMGLPWGLTPEDLRVFHHTAESAVADAQREAQNQDQIDNDMQEVKTIVNTLAAAAQAEAEAEARAQEEAAHARLGEQNPPPPPQQPGPSPPQHTTMLVQRDMSADERPHYVQPRSVRSVDGLLHREKRIKRLACNCA